MIMQQVSYTTSEDDFRGPPDHLNTRKVINSFQHTDSTSELLMVRRFKACMKNPFTPAIGCDRISTSSAPFCHRSRETSLGGTCYTGLIFFLWDPVEPSYMVWIGYRNFSGWIFVDCEVSGWNPAKMGGTLEVLQTLQLLHLWLTSGTVHNNKCYSYYSYCWPLCLFLFGKARSGPGRGPNLLGNQSVW